MSGKRQYRPFLSFFHTRPAQAFAAERLFSIQFEVYLVCGLIEWMATISQAEFERIVQGIFDDRELIIKHNPIGTPGEILLWMLMSTLVSYLSMTESETPCFTGRPDARVYRDAILFILQGRMAPPFDPALCLATLESPETVT